MNNNEEKEQEVSLDSNDILDSTQALTNEELENNAGIDENSEINDDKDIRIKELEDKYIRVYADFENIKKRLEREKFQSLEYANEGILKDVIPILDTLESAIGGINDDMVSKEILNNIKEGIKLTIDNFLKVLKKHDVIPIDNNIDFDPNLHDAIMQVKDDSKENGSIANVMQKGYKYKDRVLRPSMVAITKND